MKCGLFVVLNVVTKKTDLNFGCLIIKVKKRDGIYDKMIAINESRRKKDPNYSIFDLNVGKDLDVTIKRTVDKKLSITITDNDERTALTDDIATGVKWIEDSKTWQDVFKVKQYEYMEILINGGVPIYDREQKCYIDKKR